MKFNEIQKKQAIIAASIAATVVVTGNVIKNIKRKREIRQCTEEFAELLEELSELSYECSRLAEENHFLRKYSNYCQH